MGDMMSELLTPTTLFINRQCEKIKMEEGGIIYPFPD
jgi:hypothetical protein